MSDLRMTRSMFLVHDTVGDARVSHTSCTADSGMKLWAKNQAKLLSFREGLGMRGRMRDGRRATLCSGTPRAWSSALA